MDEICIIGGGLAGVEASWQILKRGGRVRLYEMKPKRFSKAHRSEHLAELVCSNSFKSQSLENASGVLKEEMRMLGSLVMESAERFRVKAGEALAVDREKFSEYITARLLEQGGFELIREEVKGIPKGCVLIIATGPLTSEAFEKEIERISGGEGLYFYDAIAPVVYADSINMGIAFRKNRYDRSGADYINCPMTEDEYKMFYNELIQGELVPFREFEEPRFFEGCVPIEEMARRGLHTLCFGPMKPVGLIDPRSGKEPYAVVQLRQEDINGELYGMVGFQTRLKYPEQKRIFRMIPGLENVEFARFGSMHRNTYLKSPGLLNADLSLKSEPRIFFAGQITGVEGYLESAGTGIAVGIYAWFRHKGKKPLLFPKETVIGALMNYVSSEKKGEFVPMNANFGILPLPAEKVRKRDKRKYLAERAIKAMQEYIRQLADYND